jgi:hypothetical protein
MAGTPPRPYSGKDVTLHFDSLVKAVQTNCDIADARHARDLTLCTYLLEMREFYRWECGKSFSEKLARAEVGNWIARREALWETLEDADFASLPLKERNFEPFAVAAINDVLASHGLVYGAGIGRFGKPQFFLGQLKHKENRDDACILVTEREYARDLSPSPAALLGNTIYLRHESLKRWLWEKIETWGVRRPGGALKEALDAYRFDVDPCMAVEQMADTESETLILHELGELEAGKILGGEWEEMRAGFTGRRAELFARAARDNLADCLVTLPALMERNAVASIHFWFSNFDGIRRELFPRIASAYAAWRDGDDGYNLHDAIVAGREHWSEICHRLLALHRGGGDSEAAIESLIELPDARL